MLLKKQLPVSAYLTFLSIILAVTFTPAFHQAAKFSDYIIHYGIAESVEAGNQQGVPHVLYHILVIAVKNFLATDDAVEVTAIVTTVIRLLFGATLFLAIKFQLPSDTSNALITLSVLILMLVSPIYLWQDSPFFLGYISYLPYHNPTQYLMLLFAVPVSLVALRAISPKPFESLNQRIFFTLFSAVLVLYLSLSKPSYSIAILPAMGLVVLYRLVRRLPVDWILLIIGISIPFLLMLSLQYVVAYADPTRAEVGIGWLRFFRLQRFQDWEVISRLGLSVVLPLLVYILYFREARRDAYLNFSWLVFGISLIWSYFFYERGSRIFHGNFVWSAYASMFIVVFSTAIFLLRQYTLRRLPSLSWRTAIVAVALLTHLISGIAATDAFLRTDPKGYYGRGINTDLVNALDCGYTVLDLFRDISPQRVSVACHRVVDRSSD